MKKRITKATIKSFINKNASNLYSLNQSSFDGMVDGLVWNESKEFKKVTFKKDINQEHTFGIQDAWFVGMSRDYFNHFENDSFTGYKVFNSCGSFYLAIKK